MEYGEIPPEGEFKRLLLEREIVVDETAFDSSHSGIEFRYLSSGNRFALVGPGANGRYDTPSGYENIEASTKSWDDHALFGGIPEKQEDESEETGGNE